MTDGIAPARDRIGTCSTCGKYAYPSRKAAKKAGRTMHPEALMRPYRCGQFWHITTWSKERWPQ